MELWGVHEASSLAGHRFCPRTLPGSGLVAGSARGPGASQIVFVDPDGTFGLRAVSARQIVRSSACFRGMAPGSGGEHLHMAG